MNIDMMMMIIMVFLIRNARGKIVEDAEEKRDALVVTFKVNQ